MSRSSWLRGATLALLVVCTSSSPLTSEPSVSLGAVRWSWLAPAGRVEHRPWRLRFPGELKWNSADAALSVRETKSGLHWELEAAAGASVPLRFRYDGVKSAFPSDGSKLVLRSSSGLVVEQGLRAWQPRPDGTQRPLRARYETVTQNSSPPHVEYAVALDDVDSSLPVKIDPDISFVSLSNTGNDDVVAVGFTENLDTLAAVNGVTESTVYLLSRGSVTATWTAPLKATLRAMAVGGSGDVFVLGNTNEAIPGETLIGGGGADFFVARLAQRDLALIELIRVGSGADDFGASLAVRTVDEAGLPLPADAISVAVSGSTQGLDGLPFVTHYGPLGRSDGFVVAGPPALSSWNINGKSLVVGGSDDDSFSQVGWSFAELVVAGTSRSGDLASRGNVVQPVLAGETDLLLASVTQRFDVGWLSFFGGRGVESPTSLIVLAQKFIIVSGQTDADLPLHRPWTVEKRAPTNAFIATLSGNADGLFASSRFALDSLTLQLMQGSLLGLGGSSSDDGYFEVLAPFQATRAGGRDATFTIWDYSLNRPVWSSWLGGKGQESGAVQAFDFSKDQHLLGISTDSSELLPSGATPGDLDVSIATLSDNYPAPALSGAALFSGLVGQCSPALFVKVPTAWAARQPRSLSIRPSAGELFSDPDCALPTGSVVIPQGEEQGFFYFKPSGPSGQVSVSTEFGHFLQNLGPFDVAVPVTASTSLKGPPLSVQAGECVSLGAVIPAALSRLSIVDSQGLPATAVVGFGGATCSDALGSNPEGQASLRSASPGLFSVQAAGGGITTSTTLVTVFSDGAADRVIFANPIPRLVTVGCSPAQYLVTVDASGAPQLATGAVEVALVPDGIEVFSDDTCGRPASTVTIAEKTAHSAPFYLRAIRPGYVTLFATPNSLFGAEASYDALPGISTQARLSGPVLLPLGVCTRFDLQTLDRLDHPSAENRDLAPFDLASTGTGAVEFFTDDRCSARVAQKTLPMGMWWGPLWLRGAIAGPAHLTFLHPSGGGSLDVTVQSLVTGPASIEFDSGPPSVTLGVCSPAFDVRALDTQGAPVALPGNVTLSSGAAVTFFSDATCNTPLTTLAGPIAPTGRNVFVRTTTVGTNSITAVSGSMSATRTFQAVAGAPTTVLVSPSSVSVQRDACVTADVRLVDANGFNASGAVLISSTGAVPLTFGAGLCGANATQTFTFAGAGSQTLALRGASIGSGNARFTLGGLTAANLPVTLTAPAVASWQFSPSTPLQAEAGACTPLLVQPLDGAGRTTTSNVNVAVSAPANITFHLNAACSGAPVTSIPAPIAETGATVWARGTLAQSYSVTVGAAPQGTDSRVLSVVASSPSVVSVPTTLALEGRTCASLGPIALADRFGNPVSSDPDGVTITSTGGVPLLTSTATTCGGAQATTVLSGTFGSTTALSVTGLTQGAGQLTFTATRADAGIPPVTTAVSVDWPAAVGLAFEPAPAQPVAAVAGGCTPVRVFAFDDGGVHTQLAASQSLAASTSTGSRYLGANCSGANVSVVGSISELGTDVSFRETHVGTTGFTVGVGAFSTSVSLLVDAGVPTHVRLDPVVLDAKLCKVPAPVLRIEDAFGNLSAATLSVGVDAGGDRGLTVSLNADCTGAAASSTVVLSSQATAPLGLSAQRAGSAWLTVTAPTLSETLVVPVTINVGTNAAPVVSLTSQVFELDEADAGLVVLTASDIDWDPLSWSWTQVAGPTQPLALLGPSQLGADFFGQAVFAAPRVTHDTIYDWAVLVDDGHGHAVDSGVRFIVHDTINELPSAVARALSPVDVSSGDAVQVTGEDSSDPNGEVLSYRWSLDASVPLGQLDVLRPSMVAPPVSAAGELLHFELVVTDARGGASAPASVDVRVSPTEVPRVTSIPRLFARVGKPYEYDDDLTATALTTVGGPVRWSVESGPAGLTVTEAGVVSWTPAAVGDEAVVLRATSSLGWAEQRFVVRVLAAPVIVSTPSRTGALLRPWSYDDDARPSALGAAPIGWRLEQAPTGMVIDQNTGLLTWTPLRAALHEVIIVAQNAFGEDRQHFQVAVGDGSLVTIADTANRHAQKGIGYVYDSDSTVDVTPQSTPVVPVSVPDGFRVNSNGFVSWIPSEAGEFTITVAAGAPVAATYTFTVTVEEPSNEPPLAVGVARPAVGDNAPLTSQLDGTGSTAAAGRSLVLWSWEAGDGTPPRYASTVPATYVRPGGYSPRLEVADDRGNRATTQVSVAVGLDGVFPPGGLLQVVSREDLGNGSVAVHFACQCSDPASRPLTLRWSFGDGATSYDTEPTHTFTTASRFRVRLEISNGLLTTTLSEEVEVRSGELRPPAVRAWAEPVTGAAPLSVKFTSAAADFDGVIATREWDFGDGVTAVADETQRRFDTPGTYEVVFSASDDDGLSSRDSVTIVVTDASGVAPPVFVSAPSSHVGKLGVAWKYDEDGRLAARGATRYGVGRTRAGEVLGAPEGMKVDATTGLVTWTPKSPGAWPVFFWAENEAGRVWQDDVIIDVPAPPSGCGCSEFDAAPLVLLGLVALVRRRASRRLVVWRKHHKGASGDGRGG